MNAPRSLLPSTALLLILGGCDLGARGAASLPTGPEARGPAPAWIGTFRGGGVGTVGAATVEWDDVALRIQEEPDSTVPEGCEPCLVLRLDSLFEAMQVHAPSNVELLVRREAEGEVRTLQLLRYSGGGGTGNVLDAWLRIERGTETALQARFLLSR